MFRIETELLAFRSTTVSSKGDPSSIRRMGTLAKISCWRLVSAKPRTDKYASVRHIDEYCYPHGKTGGESASKTVGRQAGLPIWVGRQGRRHLMEAINAPLRHKMTQMVING